MVVLPRRNTFYKLLFIQANVYNCQSDEYLTTTEKPRELSIQSPEKVFFSGEECTGFKKKIPVERFPILSRDQG